MIPSMKLRELMTTLNSDESTISYLIDNNILEPIKKCYKCKKIMKLNLKKKNFRCDRCILTSTIFKKTFFENCKLSIADLLLISYLFLIKTPVSGIIEATSHSSTTICAWTIYLRQLLGESICPYSQKIGGEGIIVEIDETKLGKRKYNRGHFVEGVWVIAGVERTSTKKMFAVEVEKRDSATIKEIIKKHVHSGSIIYTDCWKAYDLACDWLDFQHETVNHSLHYKDPITGVHTNTIEGINNGIKTCIRPRNRVKKNIRNYLLYYIWRRQNKNDLWKGFLNALKEIVYVK